MTCQWGADFAVIRLVEDWRPILPQCSPTGAPRRVEKAPYREARRMAEGNREMRDQVLALLLSGQKTRTQSPPSRRVSGPWTPGSHLATPASGLSPVTPEGGTRVPTDADVRLAEITAGLVAASDKERRQADAIRRLALQLERSEKHIRDLSSRSSGRRDSDGKRRSKRREAGDDDTLAELDTLRQERREWRKRDAAARKEARDAKELLADIRRDAERVLSERDAHLRVIATLQQQLHDASLRVPMHQDVNKTPPPTLRTRLPPASPSASLRLPPTPRPRRQTQRSPLSERAPRPSAERLSRTGSLPDFTRGRVSLHGLGGDTHPPLDETVTLKDNNIGGSVFGTLGTNAFDETQNTLYDESRTAFRDVSPTERPRFADETSTVVERREESRTQLATTTTAVNSHGEQSETPPRNAQTVAQLLRDVNELLAENRSLRTRVEQAESSEAAASRLGELDDELRVLEGVVECIEFSIDTEEAERLQQTMSTIGYETRGKNCGDQGNTAMVDRLQKVVQRIADIRKVIADKYGKFLADFGSPADPDEASLSLPPGATLDSMPTEVSLSRTIAPPAMDAPANSDHGDKPAAVADAETEAVQARDGAACDGAADA